MSYLICQGSSSPAKIPEAKAESSVLKSGSRMKKPVFLRGRRRLSSHQAVRIVVKAGCIQQRNHPLILP